jgi:uncharacterized protein (TIGR02996 family)
VTDAAREAARRADWPACLSALLATWREVPDPALAVLIERVSSKISSNPITGGLPAAEERIATATDVDVPAILDYALTEMRTFPRAYGAAVLLARRPRDPRIAAALARIIEDPPFVEFKRNHQGGLQGDVVEALHRIDDPRFHALLRTALAHLDGNRTRKHKRALVALAAIVRELPEQPPPELEGIDGLVRDVEAELAQSTPVQRTRSTNATELLAAIHDNPLDVGLRQVYADVLQETGDPHGEFIGLQCGRTDGAAPSKRERELVKAYGRKWLGDIEPIIRKQGVVYRRGFVACVREGMKYTKHLPLFESLAWTTVEELELEIWDESATKFLCDPRWKSLRKVYGLYHSTFESLRGCTLPWTALGIRYARPDNWAIAADVLPDLVEIDLANNTVARDHLPAITSTPLATRVRKIRAGSAPGSAGELAAMVPATTALELVGGYSFPGEPDGESVVVTGTRAVLVHHGQKLDLRFAMRVLGELPRLSAIELRTPAKARVDDARWADFQKSLARHGLTLERP